MVHNTFDFVEIAIEEHGGNKVQGPGVSHHIKLGFDEHDFLHDVFDIV